MFKSDAQTIGDKHVKPSRAFLRHTCSVPRPLALAIAALSSASATAFPIDVGSDDWAVRWDNTVKYSLGVRAKDRMSQLADFAPPPAGGGAGPAALSSDDGDRNFKKGRPIFNRLDLLTEFDAVYRRDFGVRLSGAAWYDDVYNRSNANDSPATFNPISVPNDRFPEDTRKLHGRKAEILDAFVFGAADIGSARLSGRLGRHTVLWGESLFYGPNAIAGTQAPVDAIKGTSAPGSTTKEVLMPVGQVSAQLRLTNDLALIGYYQYEWERTRLPGVGSYFSVSDAADAGGERLRAAPGVPGNGFARGPDLVPSDSGQGGLGLKTKLGQFDVGAYAVRYHAKTPAIYARPGVATGIPTAALGQYQLVFPQGIRAFGASATTSVGDVNYAAEVSVRRGTPLTSDAQTVLPGVVADNRDNPLYAIGNSLHAQVSAIWVMPRMFFSAEPSLSVEVAWNRLTSCERNCLPSPAGANRPYGALDPNATRDAAAIRFALSAPQRNVLDGLDLIPSISAAYASGRSSVVVLGPDKGGDVTLTLGGNYLAVWDFSLAYTYYYGPANTPGYASTNPQVNGTLTYAQSLKDRNFISFFVKRAF